MKFKNGDIVTRVKGHLSVVCLKDKQCVCNDEYDSPPVDGNF
jgi:hypothetical protein